VLSAVENRVRQSQSVANSRRLRWLAAIDRYIVRILSAAQHSKLCTFLWDTMYFHFYAIKKSDICRTLTEYYKLTGNKCTYVKLKTVATVKLELHRYHLVLFVCLAYTLYSKYKRTTGIPKNENVRIDFNQ